MASYKERNGKVKKIVKFKIYILSACHTLYLPVCKLVFTSWYTYLFTPLQHNPEMTPGRMFFYLSYIIFLGFVVAVPYVTMRIISINKPRGSTEVMLYAYQSCAVIAHSFSTHEPPYI